MISDESQIRGVLDTCITGCKTTEVFYDYDFMMYYLSASSMAGGGMLKSEYAAVWKAWQTFTVGVGCP